MEEKLLVGRTFRAHFTIDASLVKDFADLSGDRNPIHLDDEEAKEYGYPRRVAHGALLVALLSRMIGMEIPGAGATWISQSVEWVAPVFIGDDIDLTVTVEKMSKAAGVLSLGTAARNQKGEIVMKGNAEVKIAQKLTERGRRDRGTGRVALVTGGSRGIGAAIAKRLGASGMNVIVNYHESAPAADRVVQEIRSNGVSAQAFAADLGDPAAVSNMIQEVISSFGRLDIVVHGASPIIHPMNVAEIRYNDLEPYFKVYVGGSLALTAAASPGMAERKFGRFIFLGTSYMFTAPPAKLALYVTAKQALWGLVKSMATELGKLGITSNMVSPGMTVTDLTAGIPARAKELEVYKTPMRRLATVDDTAETVAFLASDAAGYVNGVNLPLTGGPVL